MKKLLFTIAIAVLATVEMSGQTSQRWSGSTNTFGNIQRDGDITLIQGNVHVQGNKIIGYDTWDTYLDSSITPNFTIGHFGMTKSANVVNLSGWDGLRFNTYAVNRMTILNNGKVGIGSQNPDEKLTVKGKIHAEEVRVDLNVPADYVFEKYYQGTSVLKPEYKMPTLAEVEAYTKVNNHLPEMPSAQQIQNDGLYLSKMTNLLLQKIEELTLYTIEQEKKLVDLQNQLNDLKK